MSTSSLWSQHPGVRAGHRLRFAERASDGLCGAAGSWAALGVLAVGGTVVLLCFRDSGGAAVLALILALLAVAESVVVLMALRRADRIAAEIALHRLAHERSAAAVTQDLRDEVGRLHREVARVAAQAAIATQPASHQPPRDVIC